MTIVHAVVYYALAAHTFSAEIVRQLRFNRITNSRNETKTHVRFIFRSHCDTSKTLLASISTLFSKQGALSLIGFHLETAFQLDVRRTHQRKDYHSALFSY